MSSAHEKGFAVGILATLAGEESRQRALQEDAYFRWERAGRPYSEEHPSPFWLEAEQGAEQGADSAAGASLAWPTFSLASEPPHGVQGSGEGDPAFALYLDMLGQVGDLLRVQKPGCPGQPVASLIRRGRRLAQWLGLLRPDRPDAPEPLASRTSSPPCGNCNATP